MLMKFVFSALVSDARGKFGNAVFSGNKSGQYIRSFVTPTNPNTAAQQAVRATFGGIASAWRALTEAQRSAWQASVGNFPQTDVFGKTVILSGFQLFTKFNNSLQQIGRPGVNDPGAPVSFPSLEIVSSAESQFTFLFYDYAGNEPVLIPGFAVAFYATAPQSVGRDSASDNEYRLLAVRLPGDEGAEFDIAAAYAALYGPQPQGTKIFIRGEVVSLSTGQRSLPSYGATTWPAAV